MVITKKHVYIHLPKTGGTFLTSLLRTSLNCSLAKREHSSISLEQKNTIYKDKIIVGSIRNPFDYYVSTFSFAARAPGPVRRRAIFGVKSKPLFEKYPEIKELFNDGMDVSNFQKWLPIFLNDMELDWPKIYLPKNSILEGYRHEHDIGYLTWVFMKMFYELDLSYLDTPEKNKIADIYIKTETLNEQASEIFDIDIKKLNSRPKSNGFKRHKDYREYYNDELIEMVYRKDKYIFDKFGYKF